MVVKGGAPKGKISSSHLHFLSDPLAPVRAFTINSSGLTLSQPRLTYSSSNGSDHSLIKLELTNSAATSSGSAGSRNSLVTTARKSSSFNKADGNRETFNLTLDFPHHKLGNGNGTLDFPSPKIYNNNNTLDLPHVRLSHANTSPSHVRRKETNLLDQHFNQLNLAKNISHVIDQNSSSHLSYTGSPAINDPFFGVNRKVSPQLPKGPNHRKISNRSLHGVFHSRLSGPLASLQPVPPGFKPQSTRARKKRHSAIAFFNNKDKENVQLELSSSPVSCEVQNGNNSNLPSVLHQLATMCRAGPNGTANCPATSGGARVLGQGLSLSESSLAPAGLNGPGQRSDDSSDFGRARKVSLVLRALAGRLSLSLGKAETLATNEGLNRPFIPRPSMGLPSPDPTSPPLPPPNRSPSLLPLAATLSAGSSDSSSSNEGKFIMQIFFFQKHFSYKLTVFFY